MLRRLVARLIAAPDFRGKGRLMRLLMAPLDGIEMRSGYGPLLRVAAADATSRFSLRCTRDYDPVFAAVDRLQPGMAFIDVGANLGLFALVAAERVGADGAVIAFEPNPPAFAQLLNNVRGNRADNVHAFSLAVGRGAGTAAFDPGPRHHSGLAHLDPDGSSQVTLIGGAALLELVAPLIGTRPTVIKIDVEGAEALALAGLAPLLERPQVQAVIVEVDAANLARFGAAPAELYAAMAELGFEPRNRAGAAAHYDEIFSRTASSDILAS